MGGFAALQHHLFNLPKVAFCELYLALNLLSILMIVTIFLVRLLCVDLSWPLSTLQLQQELQLEAAI